MKLLDALASLPLSLAFISAGSVAAERVEIADTDHTPIAQSASIYPFIAIAALFLFLVSALFLIALETRREDRDKRNQDES